MKDSFSGAGDAWQPIATAPDCDRVEVDLWMEVPPSPRSMGWGDSFRVTNAYRIGKKWFHETERGEEKELYADYITHWMPLPPAPCSQADTDRPRSDEKNLPEGGTP